jgi:hypothetical protein
MVAMGNWSLAHGDGTRELQVRAELLRDGGSGLPASRTGPLGWAAPMVEHRLR